HSRELSWRKGLSMLGKLPSVDNSPWKLRLLPQFRLLSTHPR
ncbi:WWTR1 isoform 4, partial [Pongo abelii]